MKPQIPWLRVLIEGVVIVGSILLALAADEWRQNLAEQSLGEEYRERLVVGPAHQALPRCLGQRVS